jgi:arginase
MPAVDAPSPGGIAFPELELLLAGLVESPHCLGVELTVFDPDYDPDGGYAEEITAAVVAGLLPARTVAPRPDLVAARRDLSAARAEPSRPAETVPAETVPADPVQERRAAAAAESVPLAAAAMSDGGNVPGAPTEAAAPAVTMHGVEDGEEVDARPDEEVAERAEDDDPPVATRPLGQAPLLDSEPLPATRPGMLRPRPATEGGFSLPAQRPAFDLGPEEPADMV